MGDPRAIVTWLERLGQLGLCGTVGGAGGDVTELAGPDIGDEQTADQDPGLLHLALPGVHLHLQKVRLSDNNQIRDFCRLHRLQRQPQQVFFRGLGGLFGLLNICGAKSITPLIQKILHILKICLQIWVQHVVLHAVRWFFVS